MSNYKCMDCGNQDEFYGTAPFTTEGTADVLLDNECSIIEEQDRTDDDTDYGDVEDIKCSECDSSNIEWGEWDDEEPDDDVKKEEEPPETWKDKLTRKD